MRIVNQIKSLFSAKQRREVYEENIKSANEFLECFGELNYFSYSDMQRLKLKYQSTYVTSCLCFGEVELLFRFI